MNKFDGMAPRPALAGVPNAKQLGVQRLRARRRRVAVMRKVQNHRYIPPQVEQLKGSFRKSTS